MTPTWSTRLFLGCLREIGKVEMRDQTLFRLRIVTTLTMTLCSVVCFTIWLRDRPKVITASSPSMLSTTPEGWFSENETETSLQSTAIELLLKANQRSYLKLGDESFRPSIVKPVQTSKEVTIRGSLELGNQVIGSLGFVLDSGEGRLFLSGLADGQSPTEFKRYVDSLVPSTKWNQRKYWKATVPDLVLRGRIVRCYLPTVEEQQWVWWNSKPYLERLYVSLSSHKPRFHHREFFRVGFDYFINVTDFEVAESSVVSMTE